MSNYSTDSFRPDEASQKSTIPMVSDWLFMLLLLIISGNPAMAFGLPAQPFYAGVAILLFFLLMRRKIKLLSAEFVLISIFFIIILLYQSISFSFMPIVTILGFGVRLFIAYAVVRLVSDFARAYVDVIYGLAILSFIFYLPQQAGNLLGFNFPGIFAPVQSIFGDPESWRIPLFFHTFMTSQTMEYRNAGLFWEPGAFAGYLNLGVIFLSFVRNQYSKRKYWTRLIVLSLAILSTFSTTGYVAFPLALLLQLQLRSRDTIATISRIFMSAYVVTIGVIVFFTFAWEQPFMKEKIFRSIMISQSQETGWELDRIGTILFDLEYIQRRPLTGWGLHEETRLSLHPFLIEAFARGRGNGMSDFAAKLGLPALLLWMYFLFRYLFILSNKNLIRGGIGLLCFMIILNGECYLTYPLFLCFFFLARALAQMQDNPEMMPDENQNTCAPQRSAV